MTDTILFWTVMIKELLREQTGQGMVEYAVILGLILLAGAGSITVFGDTVCGLFGDVNQGISTTFEGKSWFNG